MSNAQMRSACKLTGSKWALLLKQRNRCWEVVHKAGLTAKMCSQVLRLLNQPDMYSWSAGALNTGRVRSRKLGDRHGELKCRRVTIFPHPKLQVILVVGNDQLDSCARGMFKILVAGFQFLPRTPENVLAEVTAGIVEKGSYDLRSVLKLVQERLQDFLMCESVVIGLLYGSSVRFIAPKSDMGDGGIAQVDLNDSPMMLRVVNTRRPTVVSNVQAGGKCPFSPNREAPMGSWALFPLRVGKRVIGIACFLSSRPNAFDQQTLESLKEISDYLAWPLEISVAYEDVSRYLKKYALLNELATVTSMGVDVDEVTRRITRHLQRTFRTEHVSIMLLSAEGDELIELGKDKPDAIPLRIPLDQSLSGYVIEHGQPYRSGDVKKAPRYYHVTPGIRSELTVPMKYRGRVIGVMDLESQEPEAFSEQDEQLLVVIASQLAGLIENIRLHEETRLRAENQELLHQIAGNLVGLVDTSEICRVAANLMAQRFEYELAVVLLVDSSGENLVVEGVGGIGKTMVKRGTMSSIYEGVTGKVFRTGASRLINDTSQDPDYVNNGDWTAGSELCVPLWEGDTKIGVINVERVRNNAFTPGDLSLLEALGGILTSVLMNAFRYQQLQESMQAEKLAQHRLLQSARLAAIGEMAAGVAHELNNPLTSVAGFVELICKDLPAGDPLRPDLELVLREAHRAKNVVRRLLDFSRPQEGVRLPSNINALLADVLALLQPQFRSKGVEVQMELCENLPQPVVNQDQITQVFVNLVQNALQAMPNGGQLTVETSPLRRKDVDGVGIHFTDTGVGIQPQYLDRIFEPFFTTQPLGEGTGLGLAISYGIVKDHGGVIDVESEPQNGSLFRVWLPIHSA